MTLLFRRLPGLLTGACLLGLLLGGAGCTQETEPGPEAGTDYYPLALGDYRIFAVTDSIWANYGRQPVASYQFRERVAERITDASGQPAYRVIRSRRVLPTDAWTDDSVLVLSADQRTVQLVRNNRRTVELVFPVRPDRHWNRDAYNSRDTIIADNRAYLSVDKPFDVQAGGKFYSYEHTLTTGDIEDVNLDNPVTSLARFQQVYAKGSGPVFRSRRRLLFCNGSNCDRTRIFKGQTRTEVLIEKGNTP